MTRTGTRKLAPTLALGAATLLIAIGLVEAGVWVAFRSRLAAPFEEIVVATGDETPDPRAGREQAGLGFQDPNMCLHPYLGYVFRPPDPEGEKPRIAVSPDGFLDTRPFLRERGNDRFVVAVTGGSVSGQLGSFHAAHLERALLRHAGLAGREIEFVWLGMPGYHQPQQLIQLGLLLSQGGELDLLVNLDGFNELAVPAALNAPMGAHPLFPMNWSMVALDVPEPALRRHIGAVAYLQGERRERAARFRSSFWRRSPTATLFWKRTDADLAARISAHARAVQEFPVEEIPFFVRGPEADHVPTEEMLPRLVDVWKRGSLAMHALCEANDIVYLHCLQPNQYDPGSKRLSAAENESAYDPEGPYRPVVEQGYPMLRAAGRELVAAGVAFHDLSMAFEEARETLYVDSCCHFNGEGNRILSDAIGEAVRHTL